MCGNRIYRKIDHFSNDASVQERNLMNAKSIGRALRYEPQTQLPAFAQSWGGMPECFKTLIMPRGRLQAGRRRQDWHPWNLVRIPVDRNYGRNCALQRSTTESYRNFNTGCWGRGKICGSENLPKGMVPEEISEVWGPGRRGTGTGLVRAAPLVATRVPLE